MGKGMGRDEDDRGAEGGEDTRGGRGRGGGGETGGGGGGGGGGDEGGGGEEEYEGVQDARGRGTGMGGQMRGERKSGEGSPKFFTVYRFRTGSTAILTILAIISNYRYQLISSDRPNY